LYGNPPLAAALALALEPTGWKGAGTVSRSRDLKDKTLQEYISMSIALHHELATSCSKGRYSLADFLEEVHAAYGKNLAAGEIFLLYLSAYAACARKWVVDAATNAAAATGLALERGLSDYLSYLYSRRPSYFGRWSHSLFAEPPSELTFAKAALIAKNIPFDPVIQEAANAFPVSRSVAAALSRELGCNLPSSEYVDWAYRLVCSKYLDYLVYRKSGLETAKKARESCIRGEPLELSLGSIADVVGAALYYYFNQCFATEFTELQRLAGLLRRLF